MTNWPKVWADFLGPAAEAMPPLERTWNVAPTRKVPVVRVHQETGAREVTLMTWGLVPSWATDPSIGSRMINARGETVAEKPAFRAAFKRRRCLMLTSGFYEWQNAGEKNSRPWFIRLKHLEVFAFAALWETWRDQARPDAPGLETCAIVTIEANAAMQGVHHRMPVILDPRDWACWLDPARQDPAELLPLLKPCPPEWLELHPVSRGVNNPRNDREALTAPAPS